MASSWRQLRTELFFGYAPHAGRVVPADETRGAAKGLQRTLTADLATGIIRHADTGYEKAVDIARTRGVTIPK